VKVFLVQSGYSSKSLLMLQYFGARRLMSFADHGVADCLRLAYADRELEPVRDRGTVPISKARRARLTGGGAGA